MAKRVIITLLFLSIIILLAAATPTCKNWLKLVIPTAKCDPDTFQPSCVGSNNMFGCSSEGEVLEKGCAAPGCSADEDDSDCIVCGPESDEDESLFAVHLVLAHI